MPRACLVARCCLGLTLALAVLAAGCRKGPKLVPVVGKVYLKGAPVQTGETVTGFVVFHADPARGNKNLEDVKATIEADGTYRVHTRDKEGALPGWYFVTVELARTNPKDPYDHKPMIPERYVDKTKSKLEFEVVDSPEPGRYDIKLVPESRPRR
jgi:hypothetical protein